MFRYRAVVLLMAVSVYAVASAGVNAKSIPGIDITTKKSSGTSNVPNTRTDNNGKFTLTGLTAGTYTLTFTILPTQQIPDQTVGKTYSDSKSNTAVFRLVGGDYSCTFQGWPYEILLKGPGVTFGEGKITKIRSAVSIEIAFTVTGTGTVSISGTAQANEVTPPPSETPSSR